MATFEDRLAALEREQVDLKQSNEELKQKVELQTIAIGGLVSKDILERVNEKNDKIFQALISHHDFTSRQLAELRERVEVQVEGKIAGLQTEMRQGFQAVNARFDAMDARFETIDARFTSIDKRFEAIDARFTSIDKRFEAIDARFDQQDAKLQQILDLLTGQGPRS